MGTRTITSLLNPGPNPTHRLPVEETKIRLSIPRARIPVIEPECQRAAQWINVSIPVRVGREVGLLESAS
jgi:hypothetical protein